jgi:hypothetical protein
MARMSTWGFWVMLLVQHFEPKQRVLTVDKGNACGRVSLTVVFMAILGAVSGVLYAGGGMFFANIIISAWNGEVRRSALGWHIGQGTECGGVGWAR